MEFPDFPLEIHEPLYDLLSLLVHRESVAIKKKAYWSSEENKMFENALAELDPTSPSFFEDIASKIPRMTIEEIKEHYLALIVDVEMIECGEIPVPITEVMAIRGIMILIIRRENISKWRRRRRTSLVDLLLLLLVQIQQLKRDSRAKREFLGLKKNTSYFLWDSTDMEKDTGGAYQDTTYVITKTPTQLASHAQNYFKRLTSTTPIDRRRPRIHDIKTVNPTTFAVPQIKLTDQGGNNVCLGKIQENLLILLHNFSADSSSHAQNIYPSLNLHNYTSNGDGSTMNNSRMFSPINYSSAGAITFSSADPIVNQTSGLANHPRSAICSFSFMSRNQ